MHVSTACEVLWLIMISQSLFHTHLGDFYISLFQYFISVSVYLIYLSTPIFDENEDLRQNADLAFKRGLKTQIEILHENVANMKKNGDLATPTIQVRGLNS